MSKINTFNQEVFAFARCTGLSSGPPNSFMSNPWTRECYLIWKRVFIDGNKKESGDDEIMLDYPDQP